MDKGKEIEELKLIIAENMAKYSKAGMPYEEALKMCALGILASGYRKADEVRKEMNGEIEKLKSALDDAIHSFTRMETLYKIKCNELEVAKESARKETAKEILQWLYSEAISNRSETVELNTFQIEKWAKKCGVEVEE